MKTAAIHIAVIALVAIQLSDAMSAKFRYEPIIEDEDKFVYNIKPSKPNTVSIAVEPRPQHPPAHNNEPPKPNTVSIAVEPPPHQPPTNNNEPPKPNTVSIAVEPPPQQPPTNNNEPPKPDTVSIALERPAFSDKTISSEFKIALEQPNFSSSSSEESSENDNDFEALEAEVQLVLDKAARRKCKKLAKQFKKSSVWKKLSVENREAIRNAIKNCSPPPFGDKWEDILGNESLLAKLTDAAVLEKIPKHPQQGLVDKAKGELWWRLLKKQQQKKLTKLILKNKDVPKDWKSWSDALTSAKFAEWLAANKRTLLDGFCEQCKDGKCRCHAH